MSIQEENYNRFRAAFGDILIKQVLDKDTEEKTVKNPKATEKVKLYSNAIREIQNFLSTGKGSVKVDPPYETWNYHVVKISLNDEFFNNSEISTFAGIIKKFDSMCINGDQKGNISIHLTMEDMYIEA